MTDQFPNVPTDKDTILDESKHQEEVDGSKAPVVQNMSIEDRNIALARVMQADPGVRILSKRGLVLVCMLMVVCMCGGDAGFDGPVMSAVNSMSQFKNYFQMNPHKQSLIFGMYAVGQITAFIPASTLPDIIGRRYCMLMGNLLLCVGAIISSQATEISVFIGGRFLTGLGCTFAASSAKSYMAEVTSPATRGRWLGLLNSFYYVGQLLASGISIPFGQSKSLWAWRAPILLQSGPAAINICFVLLLPESPRWLYAHGHTQSATEVLARLHSCNGDPNSPLVEFQIQEFQAHISLEGADKRWWDFRQVLKTRAHRYRMGMAAIISIWGQFSGNSLITYFLPELLQQAGIQSTNRQRVLNFVNSVTSFISALLGTVLTDFIGRRSLLLISSTACTIGMAVAAGLFSGAGHQSNARANIGIAFIYLFMCAFSFGYTPLQAVYPAEVIPFENRAKGIALQTLLAGAMGLINTFAMPIALGAIKWKTYIIFAVVDIVGVAVIWTWAVETKRLTLEDLDEVFASANPKKTSLRLAKMARKPRPGV